MKPATAAALLVLVSAAPAHAGDVAGLLTELDVTAVTLVEMGDLARERSAKVKVWLLAELMVPPVRELDAQVQTYALRHRIVLAELPEGRLGGLAGLDGDDFDDAFLEALISRCETTLRSVEAAQRSNPDRELEGLLRLARQELSVTMNDARRARGEYVPLSPDGTR